MKAAKRKRHCRICGKPEKRYAFGYSSLTPFSEICTECLNKQLQPDKKGQRR